jgi:pimeloyl-ACP methyl ester carboxylesterase
VLVHAGICDSGMWDAQWGALADGRRLIRFDMRGFGRSPVPSAAYSHARDLIAVMDAAGISEAAIVGASMGGRVALEAALAAPARVSALVLVGSGLPGHEWSAPVREYWEAEEAAIERGDLAAAPGARAATIPDAAHLPSMERPELFDRLVTGFLSRPA